jgi:hypothetical protein
MGRWIKRLLAVAIIGGIALAIVRSKQRSVATPSTSPAPESAWPPFEPAPAVPEAPDWLATGDDGSCPDGYPIKAKDGSRIFHAPGGRFYERTRAERCYATTEAAERDGYRRAKA